METIIILLTVSNIGCWYCLYEYAKKLDESFEKINKKISDCVGNVEDVEK